MQRDLQTYSSARHTCSPVWYSPAWKVTCIAGALILSACTKQDSPATAAPALDEPASELKWARAALERNPELRVVSVDAERHSIKVTIKSSGETTTITPGELAAIPIGDLVALTNSVNASREAAATKVVEESIPVATLTEEAAPERTATDYKVETQDGRMRITGPGVNIEAVDPNARSSTPAAQPRFDEPIICEGPRMMHLDRRRLKVDGDAIVARGGCELHLTNSEINATGTAIVVQNATVHIGNSLVLGGSASFDAGPEAKLFLLNTRFTGTARRDAQAKVTDQGGNFWR